MKNIQKIVITGGPCGGKTTAMSMIAEMLRNEGYTVILANETATELINDYVRPFGDEKDKLKLEDFQKIILDVQLTKENARFEAAEKVQNEKVVVLLDRGILDNRAYIPFETFDEFRKAKNITIDEIMERYDLVIHLRSTAVDKKKAYTLENNGARTESVEKAAAIDRNTLKAWEDHPNFIELENDCSFNEKMNRAIDIVRKSLGLPKIYRTKKYLVEEVKFDAIIKGEYTLSSMIIESFVGYQDDNKTEIYTKMQSDENDTTYSYTRIEKNIQGKEKITKRIISEDEYNTSLERLDTDPIRIHRYLVHGKDNTYKLDLYHTGPEMITIEVPNEKRPPEFVTGCVDITNDESFRLENLYNLKEKESPKQYLKQRKEKNKKDCN